MSRVVSPRAVAASLTELWSPRVVAEVDDSYVKVAKVKGTFGWHAHDDEDEFFFILEGIVPKGARHNPIADEECHVMLIEKKTTLHTGNGDHGQDPQRRGTATAAVSALRGSATRR